MTDLYLLQSLWIKFVSFPSSSSSDAQGLREQLEKSVLISCFSWVSQRFVKQTPFQTLPASQQLLLESHSID